MTDVVKIESDGKLLVNAMALVRNFSRTGVDHAAMRFMKKGIVFGGMNKGNHSIVSVEIRADQFDKYEIREEFMMELENEHYEKLKDFVKHSGTRAPELLFKVTEKNVMMRIGNLKGRYEYKMEESFSCFQGMESVEKWSKEMEIMGTIEENDIGELRNYMMGASTWGESSGNKITEFNKKGKQFTMSTEIEEGDDIYLNIGAMMKGASKEDWRCLYQADDINMMIKRGLKLSKTLTIISGTDKPIVLSASGRKPSAEPEFKESVDFWLMLAPRIED